MLNEGRENDSQCFPVRQMYNSANNFRERMRCTCTGISQCAASQCVGKDVYKRQEYKVNGIVLDEEEKPNERLVVTP